MWKRFLATLIVSALLIYAILYSRYDLVFEPNNVLDSIFIVGMVMFFIGIIIATNITQVFQGFTYTLRNVFKKQPKHLSYYDYKRSNQHQVDVTTGIPLLFIGGLYFFGTIIISYFYYS